jgi:hypothetical protein
MAVGKTMNPMPLAYKKMDVNKGTIAEIIKIAILVKMFLVHRVRNIKPFNVLMPAS